MDRISPERRSRNMSRIRSKGMKPEIIVRRLVYGLGFRYRLHGIHLPGKPDLVFKGRRKVIFVHGCFWHQHGNPECGISRMPRTNQDYWVPKLTRNIQRDKANQEKLELDGWSVLIVWECETLSQDALRSRLLEFLKTEQ